MILIVKAKNSSITIWSCFKLALLWVVITMVVMLPRLLNLDTFIGPDEKAIWGWGNRFALTLAQGDWRHMLIGDGYPGVTVMWTHTIGIAIKWLSLQLGGHGLPFEAVIGLNRPAELYPERRLFLAFLNGLQILAAYPLLRTLWNRQVAFLAIGFMALEPLALTFTRMIRADALLSGFMLLSILATLAYLKTNDQRYNWLAGAMGGLATLSKSNGGVTVLIAIFIYFVLAWKYRQQAGWQSRIRWFTTAVVGWVVPAAVLYFGLWPAWWTEPVNTFNLVWGKVLFHAIGAAESRSTLYFWGTVHPHGPGVWFYFVLAGLRLTPWLLLGGLIAAGRCLWWSAQPQRSRIDWAAMAILFYIGVYWLLITIPGQKADRHFLPIIPGLAVLTAVESANCIHWIWRIVGVKQPASTITGYTSRFIPLLPLILIITIIGHISRYHPLYSTYFNPLSGSPQFWEWTLPVGHGEGVNSALLYLADQGDMSQKTLVCGTNLPRCEPFFKGNLLPQEALRSGAWFKADYALWHVDEQQMDVFPAEVLAYLRRQPQIYVARYHGLDYSWLHTVPKPTFLTSKARLEGVARLFGYDSGGQDFNRLAPGDTVKLHVYWQNEGQAHQQQFWWRVVDHSGYVWSEALTQPLPDFETEAPQKGAVVEGTAHLPLPPDLPPGPYTLRAGFATVAGDVGEFPLPAAGSELTVIGVPTDFTPAGHMVDRLIAPGLQLQGYDLSSQEATPGDSLWLTLHWQGVELMPQDYTLVLRLLDQNGQTVTTEQIPPVSAGYPTSIWPVPGFVRGSHQLSLPVELAPGQYQFELAAGEAVKAEAVQLGTVNVVTRKAVFDPPPMQFSTNAVFGDVATLLGYDLAGNLSPEGARVAVTLYWQAQRKTAQPYQVKLRLVDGRTGAGLAEQTAEPAQGAAPTSEWQAGEIISDRHELMIISSQPTSVNLEIQLLADSLEPAPLADGQPLLLVPEVQQKVSWRTQ